MAKKNTPFKNASYALSQVWGSGINAQHQGGRIHASARRAGVKIDTPLTPSEIEAQEIANQLAAEEPITDKRSTFEKEYDIRDGAAHVTPEKFRDFIISSDRLKRLQSKVDVVHIDNGYGFAVDLTLGETRPEQYELEVITNRHILELGLSGGITRTGDFLFRMSNRIMGVFHVRSIPEHLVNHSINMQSAPSREHSVLTAIGPNEIVFNEGNFDDLSYFPHTLINELNAHFNDGVPITISAYRKFKEGCLHVGTMWHPDKIDKPETTRQCGKISKQTITTLRNIFSTANNPGDEMRYIKYIFDDAAGIEVTYNGHAIGIVFRRDITPVFSGRSEP